MTDEALQAGARDADHLALLRALAPSSMIIVPLKARDRAVGLLWLYYSEGSERSYQASDLSFVEEIAARAALAIENARLWRKAQEAIQARDEFLTLASHELRTPLTSMLLTVQGELRRLKKDPSYAPSRAEVETWLGSFNQQTSRLAQLISQMLDVSRMTSGTLQLSPDRTDLARVVRDATLPLSEEALKKGSPITIDAAPGIIGLWDAPRIGQVVGALVSNAVKYGDGRPILVRAVDLGASAEITVHDQGIGIEREHLGRIFQRFERQASPRNYGGFGLGLWLARQLVEASRGTIGVTSDPGQGATFRVVLPKGLPESASPSASSPLPESSRGSSAS
jgi:signal transduction histidine kinase